MKGRLVDIIEDIGKGLNTEQLAQKPSSKGGDTHDGNEDRGTSA